MTAVEIFGFKDIGEFSFPVEGIDFAAEFVGIKPRSRLRG